jgi:hypothetical protein
MKKSIKLQLMSQLKLCSAIDVRQLEFSRHSKGCNGLIVRPMAAHAMLYPVQKIAFV